MGDDFRIVVAIDLQIGTDRLLEEAQRYGVALNAVVDLLHIAVPDPDFVGYMKSADTTERTQDDEIRDSQAKALRAEHQHTQALGATLRAKGVRVGRTLTVQGPTLQTILEETRKLDANLLIMGAHRHHRLHRVWFGDIAIDAAKQAPCSLLLVPIPD